MTRSLVRTILIAVCLTAFSAAPARADNWFSVKFSQLSQKLTPAKTVSNEQAVAPAGVATVSDADGAAGDANCDDESSYYERWQSHRQEKKERKAQRRALADLRAMGPPPCHPAINSSLYPCPRPDVPYEVGATLITNQAFYPHEMLYCHQYRALYPPYFYENKCGLACLPFFPKPCLKGTVVTVKYKGTLPCGFQPPPGATKCCFSNTQFK
jgi:hypothetical protein